MKVTVQSYREMTEADIRRLLPVRPRESHKGDFGRVLLLCGSTGFTGRCTTGQGNAGKCKIFASCLYRLKHKKDCRFDSPFVVGKL